MSPMAAEGGDPLPDDRQQRHGARPPRAHGRSAPATCAASRNGSSRSTRSSSSRRRIHWPLSHSRRSRSKRAPPFWTLSSSKRSDDLVQREDVLLRARRPAQEREVVDERLAQEPLGDVVRDRGLALALAHLRAVGVEDERQVGEDRERVAQRLEQQDVLGRVADVVLAADHVADPHRHVVHHHGEVVERVAVAADDDEVAAEVGGVDLDAVAHEVVPADHAGADPEAQGAAPALGLARGALVRRSGRRTGRRSGGLLRGLLGLAVRLQLLGRAVAGVGRGPSRRRSRGGRRVVAEARHLAVRARTGPPRPRRRRPDPRPR